MRPSLRTFAITIMGFGSIALYRTMLELNAGSPTALLAISDYGEAGILVLAAVFAGLCALRIPQTEHKTKTPWTLIALGVVSFAIGDVIWAHQEVAMGLDPFPGTSDLFYGGQYLFLGAALLIAGRRISLTHPDRRSALGFSACVGIGAAAFLWLWLLGPHVVAPGAGDLATILNVAYPVADILVLFTPALFLLLVLPKTDSKLWVWPWAVVAAGALTLAASDAGFSWLDATGGYASGSPVDYGWALAHVLLAVGVSLAADLSDPKASGVISRQAV